MLFGHHNALQINLNINCLRKRTPFLPYLALIFIISGCVTTQVPIDSTSTRDNLHLNINVHDPSMIMHDSRYYMFHTGRGISNWVSRDKVNWLRLDPVFNSAPLWTENITSNFDNYISAPNISYHDGKYYLYYSISSTDLNDSAIGLVTNQSVNPSDPDFKWEDQGMVIGSYSEKNRWNATDAALTFDENGIPWLAFASHQMGIKMVRLKNDLKTVEISSDTSEVYTIAKRGKFQNVKGEITTGTSSIQMDNDESIRITEKRQDQQLKNCTLSAPFIFKRDMFYYLFATREPCHQDEDFSDEIIVGRSKSITGPYVGTNGDLMDNGGGSTLIRGNEEYSGVAHNSIYQFEEKNYLVGHAYNRGNEKGTKLIILEIIWNDDNWPNVDLGRP